MLKRNWDADKDSIKKTFEHITNVKVPIWLIFHPEGTRIDPKKIEKSHEWSKKNDLPVYNHLLCPRTKGFTSTVQGISSVIDAVYDITIAYEDSKIFGFRDILLWNRKKKVHLYVKRYDIQTLPKEEKELDKWLYNVWNEKEKLLDFYKKNDKFPNEYSLPFEIKSILK